MKMATATYEWFKLYRTKNTEAVNKHQEWWAELSSGDIIPIHSNEDVIGDKWYLSNGEGRDTTWYPTKQAAIKAYMLYGRYAINAA